MLEQMSRSRSRRNSVYSRGNETVLRLQSAKPLTAAPITWNMNSNTSSAVSQKSIGVSQYSIAHGKDETHS